MPTCKFKKQEKYISYDEGNTWQPTGEYRKGDVIESYSKDCYENSYFSFTAIDNCTFEMDKEIQYSTDNASSWNVLAANNSISVSSGDTVLWRKTISSDTNTNVGQFSSTGRFTAQGNVCSLIKGAAYLGVNSLANFAYCFESLFEDCSGLTDASNIIMNPKWMGENSCHYMFSNCTNLETAPELPAQYLAVSCYESMFSGCEKLIQAPSVLASSDLYEACYESMFEYCTELKTAPEIKASVLYGDYCIAYMFLGCSKLNYIKIAASSIEGTNVTDRWVDGVANVGTFVKKYNSNIWSRGIHGIPQNWTISNY